MNSDNQLCSTHRFKCHHSLEIHDGAVTKSMVHAFIYPKISQENLKSSLSLICENLKKKQKPKGYILSSEIYHKQ